jgi:hypothetical protein
LLTDCLASSGSIEPVDEKLHRNPTRRACKGIAGASSGARKATKNRFAVAAGPFRLNSLAKHAESVHVRLVLLLPDPPSLQPAP